MEKVSNLKNTEVMIRHNPKHDYSVGGNGWAHLLNLTNRTDLTTFGVRNVYAPTNRGFKTGLDFHTHSRPEYDPREGNLEISLSDKYDLRAVPSAGCFDFVTTDWLRDRQALSKRELLLKWVAGSFGAWFSSGHVGWGTKAHGGEKQIKYADQVLRAYNSGILGFRYRHNLGRLTNMDAPTFLKSQFYSVMNRMTPNSDVMFSHSSDYHKQHLKAPDNSWDQPAQAGLPRSVIVNESHMPASAWGSHTNCEDSLDLLRCATAETYAIRLSKENLLNYLGGFEGIKREEDHLYKTDKNGKPAKIYHVTWVAKHVMGKGPHDSDVHVDRSADYDEANNPDFLDPTKCEVLINRYIGYRYANRYITAAEYHARIRSSRADFKEGPKTCEPELLEAMKTHKLLQVAYISRKPSLKFIKGQLADQSRPKGRHDGRMNVQVLHCRSDQCENAVEDEYFAIVRKYTYAGLAKRLGSENARGVYQLAGKKLYLHCDTYNRDNMNWSKTNSELCYHNFNVGLLPVTKLQPRNEVSYLGSFLSSDRSNALPNFINKFNKSSKVVHLGSMVGCTTVARPKSMEVPNRGDLTDPAYSYNDGVFYSYNNPVARLMYHRGNYFVFYQHCKQHYLNTQARAARDFCKSVVIKKHGVYKTITPVRVSYVHLSDDVKDLNRWLDKELETALDQADGIARTHQRSIVNSHVWRYHKFASYAENLHKVRRLKKFQQRVDELRSVRRIASMILKDKARGMSFDTLFNDPTHNVGH